MKERITHKPIGFTLHTLDKFPIGMVIENNDFNKIDVVSTYDFDCRLFRIKVKLKKARKEKGNGN